MNHIHRTRAFFSSVVQPIIQYSTRHRVDIILDYVPGKSVLDLGCVEHEAIASEKKEWWLHGLIRQKAKSLCGVDYDDNAINELKQQGWNVCAGNVEDLFLNEKYDVVIAGELFEHLTNHRSFLESVKRHLLPDGIFVASMPNANSFNYFFQSLVFGYEVDAWDHTSFFTPVTIAVMLEKCGMVPVSIVMYQPDEIYDHDNRWHRLLSRFSNRIQQLLCKFRPTMSRGLIVVAMCKSACAIKASGHGPVSTEQVCSSDKEI